MPQSSGESIRIKKLFPISKKDLWEMLMSPEGKRVWLGRNAGLHFASGARYRTAEGVSGQVRSYSTGERFSITYQRGDWESPSMLHVELSTEQSKSILRIHQEGLTASGRASMSSHWRNAIEKLQRMVKERSRKEEMSGEEQS